MSQEQAHPNELQSEGGRQEEGTQKESGANAISKDRLEATREQQRGVSASQTAEDRSESQSNAESGDQLEDTTGTQDAQALEETVRPRRLEEFVGQKELCRNLRVYIDAAKGRGKALDHTLFYGNPGLGKTTLAQIIASELGVNIVATSGPVLERSGDLAAILTKLQKDDLLFVDEIHRMPIAVEEILYPAMEDFRLDIICGQGPAARTVSIAIEPFTLVGATTRLGLLSSPLRDRFGIIQRLEFYDTEDLAKIVLRTARILDVPITEGGALEIGRRSRGTPRIANRLLRRVRDFALVHGSSTITEEEAVTSLARLDIDAMGLNSMDRRLLALVIENYNGGPVGIKTLAAASSEDVRTLEDIVEPYLIQCGFLKKTPRGRVATEKAFEHWKTRNHMQEQ